jgi:hypothetical protein
MTKGGVASSPHERLFGTKFDIITCFPSAIAALSQQLVLRRNSTPAHIQPAAYTNSTTHNI